MPPCLGCPGSAPRSPPSSARHCLGLLTWWQFCQRNVVHFWNDLSVSDLSVFHSCLSWYWAASKLLFHQSTMRIIYCVHGGAKVIKFHFSFSKLRKRPFLLKMQYKIVKFRNPGGGQGPPSPTSTPVIAFDKCFYICDMAVVKSLCFTFLIHKEQFAFQINALRITCIKNNYKIGLLESFERMHGLLTCEVWLFSCIAL